MIQAVLSFQFVLKKGDSGVIEAEFNPICLVFNNKAFNRENFNRGHHRSPRRRVTDSRNSLFKTHRMVVKPSEREDS